MKIKTDINLREFFNAIAECEGSVIYKTKQNDELNLKSQLCTYLFAVAFYNKDLLINGDLICENNADLMSLMNYLCE